MTTEEDLRKARDTAAHYWHLINKKWGHGAATNAERGAAYRALAAANDALTKARKP